MVQPSVKENNKVKTGDQAAHNWYRFVLSFPPHLVRTYLQRFGASAKTHILDPFCGTGTTLVECKKLGLNSVGMEANPLACFASRVKLDWSIGGKDLLNHAKQVALHADREVNKNHHPLRTLPVEALELLLDNSISPLPLHKTMLLLEALDACADKRFASHERLALAKALVSGISNLTFGPEVGLGKIREG